MDVYKAIADPTRREIIELLISDNKTISEISDNFLISRQGITKHLKCLEEASLIELQKKGRETYCSLNFEPLNEVINWMEKYKVFWENKLDNLEKFLDNN